MLVDTLCHAVHLNFLHCFLLFFIFDGKRWKTWKSAKKMILTSELHREHPFVGWSTQNMEVKIQGNSFMLQKLQFCILLLNQSVKANLFIDKTSFKIALICCCEIFETCSQLMDWVDGGSNLSIAIFHVIMFLVLRLWLGIQANLKNLSSCVVGCRGVTQLSSN